jgi:endonuclease G, mitochondrial
MLPAVFTSRRARARKPGLISTFVWLVLLLCVARFALLQCGAIRQPPNTPTPGEREQARSTPPSPGSAQPNAGGALAPSASLGVHLALGVPSDPDPSDDRLLDEHSFVLSYSPSKHVPNWVAWRLDHSYLGHVRRKNDFRPDPALPSELYHVSESDYLHSGYDRGHMCPSADREDTPEDNSTTFLFTNMEPQLHELNAGPWEKFEKYERELASRPGAVLYIVAGGVFSNPFPTIGRGVAVPAANFKIVVVLSEGQGASDVNEHTQVVSVLMPNQPGVGEHQWTEFLTSVDDIERATGYDFLNAVAEPVQRVIEARTARL